MEEIKPKKERKFLKTMGEVALTLVRELLLNVGKKLINKSGNKRQGLVLAFIILASTFAIAQYPSTSNKQRLGFQTTGDGLVYRGRSNDTTTIKSSGLNNAYHIYDTINNVLYSYVKTKGGWVFNSTGTVIINNNFTQPVDSLFFNVGVPTNNVDTAKMRWDSDLATVVLGLNDNVPNELGFKNFWLVKNQTGATITKGSLVYANGTVGASGRITVAKFIANGSIDAKYLLGITAHDLSNGEDGYVISFGKIRQVNTDTFAAGAILYPSPTVAGVWTDVEPVAPNIDMPIGFCINTHVSNGTIAIRVASGYKLSELHDLAISSPVDRSSLYYKGGLWRDTTAALLTSDTASMLSNYLRSGVAASTYLPLTGGTLSGTLNGTNLNLSTGLDVNGNFTNNLNSNISALFRGFQIILAPNSDYQPTRIHFPNRPINFTFANYGSGIRHKWGESDARNSFLSLYTSNPFNLQIDAVSINSSGDVGIKDTTPSFTLDVNGTLGVTGETTLSNLASASTSIVTASTTGLLSGISTLPISNGGTGATTAATARTALGATVRGSNTFILPDLGAITFLRYNADNTVSQRAADGMRSDLGGTTIGQSMFTLTNPSAIRFPRFNADNTVSALDAATFRTAIGAGTGDGNGTVTSVSINPTNPNGLTVATGTTTPVISMALAASGTTGVVSNTTQSFSGAKTFLGVLNGSSDLNVTGFSTLSGGAGITNLAATSSITRLIGVNSSNAIGELTLSGGLSVSAGNLSIQAATATQTGTVISFGSQTFGGNKTFNGTVTLASATGTATSVIGRSSTGQVVDLTLGSGLNLSSGTLNIGGFISASLDFPNTSAQSSSDITVSYTGAQTSHPVMISVPDGSAPSNTNYTAWVSSAGVVKVRFNNYSASAVNPASGTFTIFVLNL
jgi:hypothetical protein